MGRYYNMHIIKSARVTVSLSSESKEIYSADQIMLTGVSKEDCDKYYIIALEICNDILAHLSTKWSHG